MCGNYKYDKAPEPTPWGLSRWSHGTDKDKEGKNGKHGRPFEDGTGEFMQRNTLYIIGNGFDLHFGLPTSTTDFRAILESQKASNDFSNASELLEWYLPRWSDFESGLA